MQNTQIIHKMKILLLMILLHRFQHYYFGAKVENVNLNKLHRTEKLKFWYEV